VEAGPLELLPASLRLGDLLSDAGRGLSEAWSVAPTGPCAPGTPLLAPVDDQEVWCTGVTYERTREARALTTPAASFTDQLYGAERPELFFKAPGWRVRGPGQPIVIRSDSGWDMAEPELGLVITADGAIVGYLIGNDVTARGLERQNPLYLPQAKVYDGACALGPAIVPVTAARPPFELRMVIQRGGSLVFEGATSTTRMVRTFEDVASWLLRALSFPRGVVLLTGCGIVPERSLSLRAADLVRIEVDQLGVLENRVEGVG
jgi:2-dehydro-3-deoxy-D-arabinonate dehydratase